MRRHPVRHARLFLDANVLISAAWKNDSKVRRIWLIPEVELVTSEYVLAECVRNLRTEAQQSRLIELLQVVEVVELPEAPTLDNPPQLPEKDQPVLAAAFLTRSDFLVTGDRKHFGEWFGKSIFGLKIEPPARFPEALHERSPML